MVAGRVEPAHHLGDDGDLRVVADLGDVGGDRDVRAAILRRIPDERATTRSRCPVARSMSAAWSRRSRSTAEPTVP